MCSPGQLFFKCLDTRTAPTHVILINLSETIHFITYPNIEVKGIYMAYRVPTYSN